MILTKVKAAQEKHRSGRCSDVLDDGKHLRGVLRTCSPIAPAVDIIQSALELELTRMMLRCQISAPGNLKQLKTIGEDLLREFASLKDAANYLDKTHAKLAPEALTGT